MLKDSKSFWSRSKLAKNLQQSNLFPDDPAPRRKFLASHEYDSRPPNMSLLLSWEYGRIWLEERNEFFKDKHVKRKRSFIKPNISVWLAKRNTTPDHANFVGKRSQDKLKRANSKDPTTRMLSPTTKQKQHMPQHRLIKSKSIHLQTNNKTQKCNQFTSVMTAHQQPKSDGDLTCLSSSEDNNSTSIIQQQQQRQRRQAIWARII